MKHTAGPWTITPCSNGGALVNRNGVQTTQIIPEADAHLIAAAPDILEALELAQATINRLLLPRDFNSTQGTRDVIRLAIEKAEGTTKTSKLKSQIDPLLEMIAERGPLDLAVVATAKSILEELYKDEEQK